MSGSGGPPSGPSRAPGQGNSDQGWSEPTPDSRGDGPKTPKGGDDLPLDRCDITEVAVLNTPNPAVVRNLRSGDILDVEARDAPQRQLLAAQRGVIAGSIISPNSSRIYQCINEGRTYQATVVDVQGGRCQVEITLA